MKIKIYYSLNNVPYVIYQSQKWYLNEIKWARFVSVQHNNILSRCSIPYFNMINHQSDSKISHYYDNDSVVLHSGRSWKANQQLYLNYGTLPNSKLLMLYRFCISPLVWNIYHCVDLYVAMSLDVPIYNQKGSVLTEMEISPFKLTVNGIPNYNSYAIM